jgi:hypothetical protein
MADVDYREPLRADYLYETLGWPTLMTEDPWMANVEDRETLDGQSRRLGMTDVDG